MLPNQPTTVLLQHMKLVVSFTGINKLVVGVHLLVPTRMTKKQCIHGYLLRFCHTARHMVLDM